MRSNRGTSIVASPVLVGAVTVLVAIIAVFIAYNANAGLPFVPTYDLKAEVPNGAKLVEGNEVRLGGYRVGVVDKITARREGKGAEERSVAVLEMKLDKTAEPLPVDTAIAIRPRSALGLKYVEITPGRSKKLLETGDTVKLASGVADTEQPEDLEDVLSTFDAETREASRVGLEGFGTALAGRGGSINEAISSLNPLLRELTPVMRNLNDPATELDGFFRGLGAAAGEAAPVAREQAELFTNMADTFDAFSRDPEALRQTIEEGPPTQVTAIRSFRAQRPFLADFADLSRRLRPAARELPRSLPAINAALATGTPVSRRVPQLTDDLAGLFGELQDLGENPNTLLALRDLDQTIDVARPGVRFIAPYQTVCNYAVYFFNPLGTHISQPGGGGTVERILLKQADREQANPLTARSASRPVDTPTPQEPGPNAPAALHTQYGGPAVDSSGRADCQGGQTGYPTGRLAADARYAGQPGGQNVVLDADTPGLRGGTFKSRQLGIDSLKDVP
ncbi:MAG TPA: MlaD family protein [Thermoleophilaceae bacterium]|nr:MlaD family protein [Thermoleophilaceae bacterium]